MLRLQPSEIALTQNDIVQFNRRLEYKRQNQQYSTFRDLAVANSNFVASIPRVYSGPARARDDALRQPRSIHIPLSASTEFADSNGDSNSFQPQTSRPNDDEDRESSRQSVLSQCISESLPSDNSEYMTSLYEECVESHGTSTLGINLDGSSIGTITSSAQHFEGWGNRGNPQSRLSVNEINDYPLSAFPHFGEHVPATGGRSVSMPGDRNSIRRSRSDSSLSAHEPELPPLNLPRARPSSVHVGSSEQHTQVLNPPVPRSNSLSSNLEQSDRSTGLLSPFIAGEFEQPNYNRQDSHFTEPDQNSDSLTLVEHSSSIFDDSSDTLVSTPLALFDPIQPAIWAAARNRTSPLDALAERLQERLQLGSFTRTRIENANLDIESSNDNTRTYHGDNVSSEQESPILSLAQDDYNEDDHETLPSVNGRLGSIRYPLQARPRRNEASDFALIRGGRPSSAAHFGSILHSHQHRHMPSSEQENEDIMELFREERRRWLARTDGEEDGTMEDTPPREGRLERYLR